MDTMIRRINVACLKEIKWVEIENITEFKTHDIDYGSLERKTSGTGRNNS